MYTLGIDIGTTKIAGVLLQEQNLLAVLAQDNNSTLPSHHAWEHCQDPQIILQISLAIINKLKCRVPAGASVGAIGISGQMHGFLYLDGRGNACSPLFTWQDSRATIPLEHGCPVTSQNLIQEKTGQHIFSGYALATHYYNWAKGLVPERAKKIISIGAYLSLKLCGSSQACLDPSEAASFGLYDLKTKNFFLQDIAKLWGSTDFLPRLVPFFHQVGNDCDGIAVFQSLGDNQASFYGAMSGPPRAKLLLNLGTGGQICFATAEPNILAGMEIRPYMQGYLAVGSTLAGGKSLELLVDFFSEVLAFFGAKMHKEEIYQTMHQQLASNDWSVNNNLWVAPYFYGTRQSPQKRGAIHNISATNFKVPQLIYGFAEAIVRELQALWQGSGLASSNKLKHIVGAGNAIRRNPLLCHIIERVFEAQLIISKLPEEAACGAAIYATQASQASQVSQTSQVSTEQT